VDDPDESRPRRRPQSPLKQTPNANKIPVLFSITV
jgi:hypothetical protein